MIVWLNLGEIYKVLKIDANLTKLIRYKTPTDIKDFKQISQQ